MKAWILIAMLAVLGGCAKQALGPDFGKSTELNTASQVVNPDAGKGPQPVQTLDGVKAAQGVEGYHTEKTDADDERLIRDVAD